ncbi:hypothetical protein C8J57DRAFT_1242921 [Mycena rebaudengoi]|nr:hypothetical protein C8J57DRAFT_1242921 [Mycena rebaudengoi]
MLSRTCLLSHLFTLSFFLPSSRLSAGGIIDIRLVIRVNGKRDVTGSWERRPISSPALFVFGKQYQELSVRPNRSTVLFILTEPFKGFNSSSQVELETNFSSVKT